MISGDETWYPAPNGTSLTVQNQNLNAQQEKKKTVFLSMLKSYKMLAHVSCRAACHHALLCLLSCLLDC